MFDDEFEWDDLKAGRNLRDHGVSFELAREIFQDAFALEWLDTCEEYREDRYAVIGMVQGQLLFVVYTPRGERKRLISARGAEPYERRRYHEEER